MAGRGAAGRGRSSAGMDQTASADNRRGATQQAHPPGCEAAAGAPASSRAPPPIAGRVSMRGARVPQSGHGCGLANSAIACASLKGPQFSHS